MNSLEIGNNITSALEDYGLTRLEAQVYLMLVMKGETEALEMSRALNIHLPQFYNIANNLQKKGFIEIQVGRPKRYRAVDPEQVIRRKTEEMKHREGFLLKRLHEIRRQQVTPPRPSVWITFGMKNVIYNIDRIIKEARCDVTVVMHKRFISGIINSLARKRKHGAQTYLIVYPNKLEPKLIAQLGKIGKVRAFETCPFGILAITDCEKAVLAHGLPNTAPAESHYGVVFDEPVVPTFLSENFYQLWLRAKPLDQAKEQASYPKAFRAHRMALLEIKDLLEKNNVVEVYVEGKCMKTGEAFKGRGRAIKVTDTEFMKNFTLRLSDDRDVPIGGPYSTLEDIEARLIVIQSSQPGEIGDLREA